MTEDLLERYNELRKRKGLPAFAKWTGTSETLQDAYNKLNGSTDEPPKEPEGKKPARAKTKPAKAEAKKPEPKKPEAKPAKKAEPPADTISLAEICKELKMDARQARMKLRAAYKSPKGLPETVGEVWVWKKADLGKVKVLLTKQAKVA